MSTIPYQGLPPVNPLSLAADAGAFPMGAGMTPSALQSLYAQLGLGGGAAPSLSSPLSVAARIASPVTAASYGPVNPYTIAADAGAFLPKAGVNPGSLQSLYAPSSLASAAESGTASAAGAGRLSSLLGRFPSMPEGGAAGLVEWPGLRAFAGRAVAPIAISQLATAGINSALPSSGKGGDVRQVLGDAATGAGIGAVAGSVVPVVGTGIGAAAGGAAGAIYGGLDSLFGDDEQSPAEKSDQYKTTLVTAAQQLGVDPAQYSAAWDLLSQSGADPKQLSVQLSQQLLQDAAAQKQQTEQLALARQQREVDQRFALAIQSQAAEFFAPYTNNIVNAGATQAELLTHLAEQLPPAYKGVMMNQAQQAIGQSQRLAGAYAAQSALIPGQFMAQAESKRQAEIQRLQYQQAVIQSQQGGGSGGGTGYDQLVQQLAGQTQQPVPTG